MKISVHFFRKLNLQLLICCGWIPLLIQCAPAHLDFKTNSTQPLAVTGEDKPPLDPNHQGTNQGYGPPHARESLDLPFHFMDRYSYADALIKIFGSSANTAATTVTKQVSHFGGPCDPYIDKDCPSMSLSQAPLVPNDTTGREAYRIRTCNLITSNDQAIQQAIRNSNSSIDISKLPLPGDRELKLIYQQFYPGATLPEPILMELKKLVHQVNQNKWPSLEAWRFIYLTLCLAPDWQIV